MKLWFQKLVFAIIFAATLGKDCLASSSRKGGLKKRVREATKQKTNIKKQTKPANFQSITQALKSENLETISQSDFKPKAKKEDPGLAEKPVAKSFVNTKLEVKVDDEQQMQNFDLEESFDSEIDELESQEETKTEESSLDGYIKTAANWSMWACQKSMEAAQVAWTWLTTVAPVKILEAKDWIVGKAACQNNCSCSGH